MGPAVARVGFAAAADALGGSLVEVEVSRPEWKNPGNPSPRRAEYGITGMDVQYTSGARWALTRRTKPDQRTRKKLRDLQEDLVLPAAEGRPAMVQNEGDIGLRAPRPYGIDYRCLVPRRAECGNLLVPVCLSATHIAFGSIRMEPVFMLLGQSAAAAAVLSIEGSLPVQEVEYAKLRERLLARGQILSLPQAARTGTRSGSRSKPQPTAVPDP